MSDDDGPEWELLNELPPGQWIAPNPEFARGEPVTGPVLWITDDPVPEAARLWARLLREHPRSGLWPLLLVTLAPYGDSLASKIGLVTTHLVAAAIIIPVLARQITD